MQKVLGGGLLFFDSHCILQLILASALTTDHRLSYWPVLLWSAPIVQYSIAVDVDGVTLVKFGERVSAYSDCHRTHVHPLVILLDHIVAISAGARCNSSCSLDRSILYAAILNATLRTAGALNFFGSV